MHNKCLGVFLVFSAIPLVILSIFILSTGKITTTKYYKELFRKSNSYQLALNALPKTEEKSSEKTNILSLISANATPVWLETTITENLDQFDTYINHHATTLDPKINISSFKDDFSAQLPAEMQEMVPDVISFGTYTDYLNNANQLITNALKSTPGLNPEEITNINKQINDTKRTQQQFTQNANSIRTGFFYGKIISYIIFALTLLMLLIIALAARHFVPAIFRWTGQTLFISGLLSLFTAFLAQYIIKNFNFLSSLKISPQTKQLITPLYNNILNDIFSLAIKISFLVAIIGLVSIIFSYILPAIFPQKFKLISPPAKT